MSAGSDGRESDLSELKIKDEHQKDEQSSNEQHPGISWHWCILTVAVCCVMYYLVHFIDHVLPTPVTLDDLENNNLIFSAESSRQYLRKICALGPRPVGSDANEILAPQLIAKEVDRIIQEKNGAQSILIEQQRGSGAYSTRQNFIRVYDNIVNVLVMLEGSGDGLHAIVLNCHFDSVPEVEGASDDAISCAVMLEILRALSQREERPKHGIVFLFNGAEEVGLYASHFYLQHPWSNKTHVVINLEAAGLGGRAFVFQSGPEASWIFNYYTKHAPHPHAQVLIEEIFQNGVIPSDTDFRIFRDFGNMKGLDMAFGRNGFVYHTKYDKEAYIPLGSHQHMGDNVMAVALALANAPELEDMEGNSGGRMVFFDYLGWFMIYYSEGVGIGINILAILMTIASITVFVTVLSKTNAEKSKYFNVSKTMSVKCITIELLILLLARFIGIGLGIGISAIVASIIHSTPALDMVWFSNVWLIFPLYWCPCLIMSTSVSHLVGLWRTRRLKISPSVTTQMDLVVSQVPWMLALLILTCLGFRSSSILFLPVLASAVANLILHLTPIYRTAFTWIWTYLVVHIFSFVIMLYYSLIIYIALIPIMGRQGNLNAELYIGLVSAALCVLVTTFIVPLMHIVKKSYVAYLVLTAFSLVMIILSVSTDVGFPYRGGPTNPTPQRNRVMHTTREYRNFADHVYALETGYSIENFDINSYTTFCKMIKSSSMRQECQHDGISGWNAWIQGPRPVEPTTTEVVLKKKECREETSCSFHFIVRGADRMTLSFRTLTNSRVVNWSLPVEIVPSNSWIPTVYVLSISRGRAFYDFEIIIDLEISGNNSAPMIDISLESHYVHHEQFRTEDFRELIGSFSDWTDVTGRINIVKSYEF